MNSSKHSSHRVNTRGYFGAVSESVSLIDLTRVRKEQGTSEGAKWIRMYTWQKDTLSHTCVIVYGIVFFEKHIGRPVALADRSVRGWPYSSQLTSDIHVQRMQTSVTH